MILTTPNEIIAVAIIVLNPVASLIQSYAKLPCDVLPFLFITSTTCLFNFTSLHNLVSFIGVCSFSPVYAGQVCGRGAEDLWTLIVTNN